MLNILSQLITYKISSVSATKDKRQQQTFHLVDFVKLLVECDYGLQSARPMSLVSRHIPRSCRILSVDAFPSNETAIKKLSGNDHASFPHLP